MDGATDGTSVKITVGSEVGTNNGLHDGTAVSISLGSRDGEKLGNEV